MAADPSDVEPFIDPVTAVLEELEAAMIEVIAAALVAGVSPEGMRARLTTLVNSYTGRIPRLIGQALAGAFLTGQTTAEADAPNDTDQPRRRRPNAWPAQTIVRAMLQQAPRLAGFTHQGRRITLDDLNRETTDLMTGDQFGTRKDAAAHLLTRYAARGMTGFGDKAGRSWDLVTYAETVTRTTTAQTLVDAHLDRLADMGHDLGIVSDAPEECDLCRPYEGKVLSIRGRTPRGRQRIRGHMVTVFDTVAGARAAGVWHPNCRHRIGIYLPGVTRPVGSTADPEGARLRAQQRAKERQIREHKRRVLAAAAAAGKNSPQARLARADLHARQSAFKAWREANDRKNIPGRTSLTVR